jgi:drug/metabolite transporter (DMT)-like permease
MFHERIMAHDAHTTILPPAGSPEQACVELPVRSERQENLRAAAIMIGAVCAFSLMDAGLKTLSTHYPALQVTALRAFASLPIIFIWVGLRGGYRQLLRARFPLHLARGVLGIVMLSSFAWALRYIPLSEAYSIFFTAPLLITALSVPLLGERVSRPRWMAIVIGLGGALILLRPTGSGVLTLAGLAVTTTAIGYAISAILVRILGRTDSTESMVFWLMVFVGAGAALLAFPHWLAIEPADWLVIAGIGASGALGQWGMTEAFSRGAPSFIAPLEYTALAWGLGLDWLIWRTPPRPLMFLGAGIIVASGIYLIRHEQGQEPAP